MVARKVRISKNKWSLWEEIMSNEEPFAGNDSSNKYLPSSEESDITTKYKFKFLKQFT